jgi:hypothetical protein
MKNIDVITYADFTEQNIKDGKDKQFIEHVEQYYNGYFHVDTTIINKDGQTFLRVFVIRGKY